MELPPWVAIVFTGFEVLDGWLAAEFFGGNSKFILASLIVGLFQGMQAKVRRLYLVDTQASSRYEYVAFLSLVCALIGVLHRERLLRLRRSDKPDVYVVIGVRAIDELLAGVTFGGDSNFILAPVIFGLIQGMLATIRRLYLLDTQASNIFENLAFLSLVFAIIGVLYREHFMLRLRKTDKPNIEKPCASTDKAPYIIHSQLQPPQ